MTGKKYGKDINFNYLILYGEDVIKLLDLLVSSFEKNLKTKEIKFALSITIKVFKNISYTYTSKEEFIKDFGKFNKVKELQIHIYDNFYDGNNIFLRMDTNNGFLFNGGYVSISSNDENWYKLFIYDFNGFLKEYLSVIGKVPRKIVNSLFYFIWVFSVVYSFVGFGLKARIPNFVSIFYVMALVIAALAFIVYEFSGNRLYLAYSRKRELYTFKIFIKWLGSQFVGIILGIALTGLVTYILKLISK